MATPKKSRSPTTIAGVSLSNPDRILYPAQGLTKASLAEYYQSVAPWMLPHVIHRPLTLVRCPRGWQSKCFYQKHINESLPAAIRGVDIQETDEVRKYLVIDDLTGLISLVQMGVLEIHPWGCREDRIESPDRMILDLDPGEQVGWETVVQAAYQVRDLLNALGLTSFPRTTGGKGLHVVVPLVRRHNWEQVKEFSEAVAKHLVAERPDRYVATVRKAARKGRIYVDYLRNSRGATAIASYSTRARAGAPVATPLAWDELAQTTQPNSWNVENIPERLARLTSDPWPRFDQLRQSLTRSMRHQLAT
jgi:bifunctional non-homologous end joining protein LigD